MTPDQRPLRNQELIDSWRAQLPPIAGVKALNIQERRGGPPGRDLDIRFVGGTLENLKNAAAQLTKALSTMAGVKQIDDTISLDKPETIITLTKHGRALGFTVDSVTSQLRQAVDGIIIQEFARGDEELTIRLRQKRTTVDAAILQNLYLRSPTGHVIAIDEVINIRQSSGQPKIIRKNGAREAAVRADLDFTITTTHDMEVRLTAPQIDQNGARQDSIIDKIARDNGVKYLFEGRSREQADTFSDMILGAILGLLSIYIILAWIFASYIRPLVIMAVIPLGAIGAFFGHYFWGFPITILSIFAIIALSGIIVNDSIIMISTIMEHMKTETALQAIINGSCDRLRAVLLTSLTTVGGLTPLLFETSLQAQFLIPMAVTIVFGLMAATFLLLLVVPCLVAIQFDVINLFTRKQQTGQTGQIVADQA